MPKAQDAPEVQRVRLAVPWRDHNPGDEVEVSDAERFELERAGYLAVDKP
jgi:hypothetical protein